MLTSDNLMRKMLDWIPPAANAKDKERCLKERQKNFKHKARSDPPPGTRILPCADGKACPRGREARAWPLTFEAQGIGHPGPGGPDMGTAWWIGETPL
jgi:hypothetical protein